METKVQKWGNSLGVRLPKDATRKIGLVDGKRVTVETDGNSIVIKKVHDGPYRLKDMVEAITKENMHDLVDLNEPVGKEVW